eukprot:4724525-Amphidinium_carterae.1
MEMYLVTTSPPNLDFVDGGRDRWYTKGSSPTLRACGLSRAARPHRKPSCRDRDGGNDDLSSFFRHGLIVQQRRSPA